MSSGAELDAQVGVVLQCSSTPFYERLEACRNAGFSFVVANVSHPRCCLAKVTDPLPSFALPDLAISNTTWREEVVAQLSDWIDVDSNDDKFRAMSEKALMEELAYYDYLCVGAVIVHLRKPSINLSRLVNDFLLKVRKHHDFRVMIRVSMNDESAEDSWRAWVLMNEVCRDAGDMGVVLEISENLPAEREVLERWTGVSLRGVYIKDKVFSTSVRSGSPCLSEPHGDAIALLSRHIRYVFLELSGGSDVCGAEPFYKEIQRVWGKAVNEGNIAPNCYESYSDVVQLVLEPLGENLRSEVYEVFEEDLVKYRMYRSAFTKAVFDLLRNDSSTAIVVMVVGAGRGPLVSMALDVLDNAKAAKVTIYAVEKNPSAIVSLNYLNSTKWKNRVQLKQEDMRALVLPVKADIMISELLGSFGDNELCPECLDGALHLLKDGGVSIPSRYQSFMAPVQAIKLRQRISELSDRKTTVTKETPVVVKLKSHFLLDRPQPLFAFNHPNSGESSNARYGCLRFRASIDSLLTGFAGYFEADLYGDVKLSTHPDTHTPNMYSWFEMWFPLHETVRVRKGELIELHFWRCVTKERVWYEWCLSEPIITRIHNANGRSSSMRLICE